MQELKERIRKEGKVLPGNIIKIDGFLNHRVDVGLMCGIAGEFTRLSNWASSFANPVEGLGPAALRAKSWQKSPLR